MPPIVTAIITLIGQLAPLAAQALSAASEDHEAILAAAQKAAADFQAAVADLPETLAKNDQAADDALAAIQQAALQK